MLFRRTCTTFVCALAVVMATAGIARAQETDYPIAPAPHTSIGGKIALASMFSTTAIVQALDFHSTFEALELGAVELNPAVKPFTKSKPAFAILKANVAASTMYLGYSLAKKASSRRFSRWR